MGAFLRSERQAFSGHSCPRLPPVTTWPASGSLPNDIVATTTLTRRHRCRNDVVTITPSGQPPAGSLQESHTHGPLCGFGLTPP